MEGVATERESALTGIHSCHRPRIPVGHVLIERTCANKHCNETGCNKERKIKPLQQQKVPFRSKTKKITERENCVSVYTDEIRVVVFKVTLTVFHICHHTCIPF